MLKAIQQGPFEHLQSVELKFPSMKTLLLLALASIKRIGDLHAFSVDDSCLEFGPADSQVILRPRPGYVPKVPTTTDQVVSLQALPPEEADPALALLLPSPWLIRDRVCPARSGCELTLLEVLHPPGRWWLVAPR